MDEQDRMARAVVFVIELHAIISVQIRHHTILYVQLGNSLLDRALVPHFIAKFRRW